MTDKRPRPPLDGSAYNGFAAGPGDHADPRPGAPRPPVANYPLPEFHHRRRRRSWLGPALLSVAVLIAAGLLAYAVLLADQGGRLPWTAPRMSPAREGAGATPRLEAALRTAIPPGLERTATAGAAPPAIAAPSHPLAAPPEPAANPSRPAARVADLRGAAPRSAPARAAQPKPAGRCDGRAQGMDRLRCRDPQFAALDHEVNAAFSEAVRAGAPANSLGEEQEAWVIRRDRAAREAPDTVPDLYQERIAKLREQAQQAR